MSTQASPPFFLLKEDLFAEKFRELSKEFLRQAKQKIQLNTKDSAKFVETCKTTHLFKRKKVVWRTD